ncbi:MAG: Asp-tRNA(Asn)/Glu-tRNA(Gln) amidotransferase subunit GatB [Deltaproteobacteria bacterium]|nr:Asp-tRNA(Asn)/Glu-tRNA(Gln) amidotransferase subunit GatB [Deltaproteobacteria bacterium]
MSAARSFYQEGGFETVIGLEVHCQLATASKLFCGCSATFGADPNEHTCPVCLAMPGVLPVLNRRAVEYAIRAALATDCKINTTSRWARKNYFYPDLPKAYQITQYEQPYCEHGRVTFDVDGAEHTVRLTRIHMEEDAGKSVHDAHPSWSLVDLNRAGVPLLEIVSEPDLRSGAEAAAYMRKMRSLVRYLGISDGNMNEGSMRCDANVSLRKRGDSVLGTRAELKNLNSFRAVERAIAYEIERQAEILLGGGAVVQETRLWDADRGVTRSMRSKEEAHDYRYFPEPDLLPLVIDDAWIERVRSELPELPDARRARFVAAYGLSDYDSGVLTASKELADWFEAAVAAHDNPKALANWITSDVLRVANESSAEGETDFSKLPFAPGHLAALVRLIDDGTISGKIAKTVFSKMVESGEEPQAIVAREGLVQVTDESAIAAVVDRVVAANADKVAEYRSGKDKLFGFFVGQVMKESHGKANPALVNRMLKERLDG